MASSVMFPISSLTHAKLNPFYPAKPTIRTKEQIKSHSHLYTITFIAGFFEEAAVNSSLSLPVREQNFMQGGEWVYRSRKKGEAYAQDLLCLNPLLHAKGRCFWLWMTSLCEVVFVFVKPNTSMWKAYGELAVIELSVGEGLLNFCWSQLSLSCTIPHRWYSPCCCTTPKALLRHLFVTGTCCEMIDTECSLTNTTPMVFTFFKMAGIGARTENGTQAWLHHLLVLLFCNKIRFLMLVSNVSSCQIPGH